MQRKVFRKAFHEINIFHSLIQNLLKSQFVPILNLLILYLLICTYLYLSVPIWYLFVPIWYYLYLFVPINLYLLYLLILYLLILYLYIVPIVPILYLFWSLSIEWITERFVIVTKCNQDSGVFTDFLLLVHKGLGPDSIKIFSV